MGSNKEVQLLGCFGKHGSYAFYKSMKIAGRSYAISSQFPVRIWPDSTILSIAEVQLIWTERQEIFVTIRLYFLPENVPEGRQQHHGEHELIALQDKIVIRATDLISWLVADEDWDWGYLMSSEPVKVPCTPLSKAFLSKKFGKNDKEHIDFPTEHGSSRVVVLNYERYIRLRTVLKRLEGSPDLSKWLSHPIVLALGGISIGPNSRILFAKEVFDYPELEDHELICHQKSPKLKGKPKNRRRKRNPSMGSESNESETSSNSSCGSDKAVKKVVNGIPIKLKTEHEEALPRRISLEGRELCGEFKDEEKNEKNSNIKKIVNKLIENGKMGNGSLKTRTQDKSGLRYDVKDEPENELLGPLGELAHKLERANASIQILPIRPDVIPDERESRRKGSRKTDSSSNNLSNNIDALANFRMPQADIDFFTRSWNSHLGLGLLYGQQPSPAPSSSQPPPRQSASSRSKNSSRSDLMQSPPVSSVIKMNHVSKVDRLSITPVDQKNNSIPMMRLNSPSPFVATSRIYGDPTLVRKQGLNRTSDQAGVIRSASGNSSDILDFSVKRRRLNSEQSSSQLTSSSKNHTNPSESEFLLDLSTKSQPSSVIAGYLGLANIPPPNAILNKGLRLTSEVTLFPSNPSSSVNSSSSGHKSSSKTHHHQQQQQNQNQNHSSASVGNNSSSSSKSKWGSSGSRQAQNTKGNNNIYRSTSSSSSHSNSGMKTHGMNDLNNLGLDPHSLAYGVHKLSAAASSRSSSAKVHKNGTQLHHQQQQYQLPSSSSKERLPIPEKGHSHGGSKPLERESGGRDKSASSSRSDATSSQYHHRSGSGGGSSSSSNSNNHLGAPSHNLHPQFFPKIDPAYLHLFGAQMPMFMPPTSLLGMNIPGMNMEHLQLYKDLLQNGMAPQFHSRNN